MLTRAVPRRRWWTRASAAAGTVAVATVAALAAPTGPAAAQQDQQGCSYERYTDADGDEVLVWTCEEGGSGSGSGSDGGGERSCETMVQGEPMQVPCVDPVFGWFTDAHGGCYVNPADPQPPEGDEAWEGHDPEDGTVYDAVCFATDTVDGRPYTHLPTTIFMAEAEAEPVALPSLEQAIARLGIGPPEIATAPDASGVGLVGLPVWLWTTSGWGPRTATDSAGGYTLYAEAEIGQIQWDMGDGGEEVCDAPGVPYEPSYGGAEPECGYLYEAPSRDEPGGVFPVTATAEWRISWYITGTTIDGEAVRTASSATQMRIHELQVVTS